MTVASALKAGFLITVLKKAPVFTSELSESVKSAVDSLEVKRSRAKSLVEGWSGLEKKSASKPEACESLTFNRERTTATGQERGAAVERMAMQASQEFPGFSSSRGTSTSVGTRCKALCAK